MKIGQDVHSKVDLKHGRQSSSQQSNFDQLVKVQSHKLKHEDLKRLLSDISVQGDRLARFRSFRDLAKFKKMIKDFLNETVYNGLELQESHNFNSSGYSQSLSVVKQIDEKLVQLTEDVMNQEKKTIDLLSIIGEIKGLLINIYT